MSYSIEMGSSGADVVLRLKNEKRELDQISADFDQLRSDLANLNTWNSNKQAAKAAPLQMSLCRVPAKHRQRFRFKLAAYAAAVVIVIVAIII